MAIAVSVILPWMMGHFGINPIAGVQAVVLGVLALVPNRWLVFSPVSFTVALLITMFPLRVFWLLSVFRGTDIGLIAAGLMVFFFIFAPLPLSLIFSRMRFRRGERFTYA
jgi:hypothetical protein